jgi:hypothetical protein
VLEAIEQSDGLLGDERVKAAHELLRELIGQDFDIDQDRVPVFTAALEATGSSRRSILRCATAARARINALTATSSRPRRPTPASR